MAKSAAAKLTTVEATLAEVREVITKGNSPESRAARVKLETYERVVRFWQNRTPSEEQYRSLFDCVLDLRKEVFGEPSGAPRSDEDANDESESRPSERPTTRVPDPTFQKS